MSDPIAKSILSKLTSWYAMDGNLNDSRGSNNLGTAGTALVSGYSSGKKGQMLNKASRAACLLSTPFNLSTNNAMTIGGWVYYDGTASSLSLFAFSFDFDVLNTAFSISVSSNGQANSGSYSNRSSQYVISTPGFTVKTYNFNVKVSDSLTQVAISPQTINIDGSSINNGFYFLSATFSGQTIRIYLNGQFRGQTTPPMPGPISTDTIKYFQVGQQFSNANTNCGLDEVFMCQNAVMTDDEIAWLYNYGNGRSYSEVSALAA